MKMVGTRRKALDSLIYGTVPPQREPGPSMVQTVEPNIEAMLHAEHGKQPRLAVLWDWSKGVLIFVSQ